MTLPHPSSRSATAHPATTRTAATHTAATRYVGMHPATRGVPTVRGSVAPTAPVRVAAASPLTRANAALARAVRHLRAHHARRDTLDQYPNEIRQLDTALATFALTAGGRQGLTTARSRVAAADAKVQSAYGGGE